MSIQCRRFSSTSPQYRLDRRFCVQRRSIPLCGCALKGSEKPRDLVVNANQLQETAGVRASMVEGCLNSNLRDAPRDTAQTCGCEGGLVFRHVLGQNPDMMKSGFLGRRIRPDHGLLVVMYLNEFNLQIAAIGKPQAHYWVRTPAIDLVVEILDAF